MNTAHVVAGFFFVALALAQAMLAGLIAYGSGAEGKETWHGFFSRWGYTLLLLMVAAHEFTEAGWLNLTKPFLFTVAGLIAAATLAAALIEGQARHLRAEKTKRDT
jgi:hypothetical protein